MILGVVKGTVVSTRKVENLIGYKFLLVQPYYGTEKDMIIAADTIGAGIGEMVIVTQNEPTQFALDANAPLDSFIVGIVDNPPIIGR
jgi:ethanolamine utilization protein EutN